MRGYSSGEDALFGGRAEVDVLWKAEEQSEGEGRNKREGGAQVRKCDGSTGPCSTGSQNQRRWLLCKEGKREGVRVCQAGGTRSPLCELHASRCRCRSEKLPAGKILPPRCPALARTVTRSNLPSLPHHSCSRVPTRGRACAAGVPYPYLRGGAMRSCHVTARCPFSAPAAA